MKIAVLVSGGVDSSVALRLLQKQGHEVTAFYLKIWLEDELAHLGDCPWEQDLAYVRAVCEQAGVSLEVVPLQKEYFEHVVAYAIDEVKQGRTPNPDIFCNTRIKFGLFVDYIDKIYPGNFEKIASGHYAQVVQSHDAPLLKRAPDQIKDQTYFLSYLKSQQLGRLVFPIGQYAKEEVRALAQEFNLPNKDRKDSQGICFLGKLKFNDFLEHYLGQEPGDMIEYESGKKLGEHKGFWYHTIGQRQGSGLSGGPWYVVDKDPATNRVYFSRNYYANDKKRDRFLVKACNWFAGSKPEVYTLQVKMRHGKKLYDCRLEYHDDTMATVVLQENDQGIAPGQFAVFYDGDMCLGAGVIAQPESRD